jgi:serine/threonine protein kinase
MASTKSDAVLTAPVQYNIVSDLLSSSTSVLTKIADVFKVLKIVYKEFKLSLPSPAAMRKQLVTIETSMIGLMKTNPSELVFSMQDFERFYEQLNSVGFTERVFEAAYATLDLYDSEYWSKTPLHGFSKSVVDQLCYVFNVRPNTQERKCDTLHNLKEKTLIQGNNVQGDVFKTVMGGKTIAVKYMKLNQRGFSREREMYKRLRANPHTGIVYAICADGVIATEWIEGETLKVLLARHVSKNLPLKSSISLIHQLVRCVQFLRKKQIAHKDLHDNNIMISKKFELRIIDFGKACSADSADFKCVGEDDYLNDFNMLLKFFILILSVTYWKNDPIHKDWLRHFKFYVDSGKHIAASPHNQTYEIDEFLNDVDIFLTQ